MADISPECEMTEASSAVGEEPAIKLRGYQQEMLEASLKRNVIVAMDTGSGKTHVAVFRILAELERSSPEKLVWFLSPTKALCLQQYDRISQDLPGYFVKSLTGEDNVDKWTDTRLWDAVLTNVRVVVGTPAVLADALHHGFVRVSKLALLVFDEAHGCIKGSAMNQIMRKFYHPAKASGTDVPNILGLSASPVMSTKSGTLETLEANLDAVGITPRRHRSELEQFVHPPQVTCIVYPSTAVTGDEGRLPLSRALNRTVESYDFSTDPYVVELVELRGEGAKRELQRTSDRQKTYCSQQLKALRQRSEVLKEELGSSAAEWYVRKCIERFNTGMTSQTLVLPDITEKERLHLASILNSLSCGNTSDQDLSREKTLLMTDKARSLVRVLQRHASASVRGIVFVEQRATVTALRHLLLSQTEIREAYSIGTFVGTSTYANRKTAVANLVELKEQVNDLDEFRNGNKNLMIATNVLEEGIDISACNLVICFDPPKNLVSFVQRRGRARQRNSRFVIFLPEGNLNADPSKWQRLEIEMKQAYLDELRQFVPADPEDEEASNSRLYRIQSTAALLSLENAKAHLYHFCAVSTLRTRSYVDVRPEFNINQTGKEMSYTAYVTLPSFVHPNVRTASSSQAWRSEATAVKDAAFQAYLALHKAGLVNDNLLPLVKDYGPDDGQMHMDQPSIVEVRERQSSWRAQSMMAADENLMWYSGALRVSSSEGELVSLHVWLPSPVPQLDFQLFWNQARTYAVEVRPFSARCHAVAEQDLPLEPVRHETRTLLQTVHGSRMSQDRIDFPVLFSLGDGESLHSKHQSVVPSSGPLNRMDHEPGEVLVWIKGHSRPYIYSAIARTKDGESDGIEPQVIVTSLPKRADFLHPLNEVGTNKTAYMTKQSFPRSACSIDTIPARYALFAAFMPSILHRLDVALLARDLQTTALNDIGISNSTLVTEAITSPSAGEAADYNRLEFLGDSILKFVAVRQVMAQHLTWPEGYLHLEKNRMVNNNTLAKAALRAGLDKYVLTKPFTGSKWRPIYIGEVLASPADGKRQMSSKVLADVIEALIGASFVDGGLDRASLCIRTLLTEFEWYSQDACIDHLLQDLAPGKPTDFSLLERLIGNEFNNPNLLLEAITHASFPHNRIGLSYERLEFLGDAVLDLIVTPNLFAHSRALKHWELHRVREAVVSGNFLGYCCMSYAIEEDSFDVVKRTGSVPELDVKKSTRLVHLHDFIRADAQLLQAKRQSLAAFEKYRGAVSDGMETGVEYPWPDLIAMKPQKFLADLVESVLGALYLDTQGDLAVCEAFAERLGILPRLRRFLDESVETAFPRERVGILADGLPVEYVGARSDTDAGEKVFSCQIRVGGVEVAAITGCGSKDEAEARAAMEAVRVLEIKLALYSGGRRRKLDVVLREGNLHKDAGEGGGVRVLDMKDRNDGPTSVNIG